MAQKNDHHLTASAVERMRKEIVRLLKERPVIIEEMQEAATQGDFSENAGYQSAKWALRRLNDRVTLLEQRIASAVVIHKTESGTVSIGSRVVIEGPQGEKSYEILGSLESDPAHGRISHSSPLGAALMGKMAGDSVNVNTVTYRIVRVE